MGTVTASRPRARTREWVFLPAVPAGQEYTFPCDRRPSYAPQYVYVCTGRARKVSKILFKLRVSQVKGWRGVTWVWSWWFCCVEVGWYVVVVVCREVLCYVEVVLWWWAKILTEVL